ncbi:hypothetical protein ACFE04_008141 [Oxalis oulophora]
MTTNRKNISIVFFLYVLLHVLLLNYQVDAQPIKASDNNHALRAASYVGVGQLLGPEDIAYDKKSGVIYTGCADGSIKRVNIRDIRTPIDTWVNTSGRPLGVAFGRNGELFVADAYKGLLIVSKDGVVTLLTDEAEGLKFNFTEGVDVANNGLIYFTDGSYKYGLEDIASEIASGEPHGRFMSYDPVTRETKVLVRDIYFANGVTVTPDQNSVIFCETLKLRCRIYHIRGPKMGLTDIFIDNLPGLPDNIRYDGQGRYWIGFFADATLTNATTGGILAADLEGKKIAYYSDTGLSLAGGNILEVPYFGAVGVSQIDSLPILNSNHAPEPRLIRDKHMLRRAEYLGVGKILGPEDIVHDKKLRVIYTGCEDGWIKKVYIRNSKNSKIQVENWVNTGGRPLGLARGVHSELIVADAYKGLLNVTNDGVVKILTDEAEGLKFNFTNGVDVAKNGMIYFTDASYKYGYEDVTLDILEGKPYGRFMSFDPATKKTEVLVRDLYFANGIVVAPDQNSVIFCESPRKRCRKYHIGSGKSGRVEDFIDNLPARTDNIRYDGQGHYWIGLIDYALMGESPILGTRGGAFATNLRGKPIAYYSDYNLSLSCCNKIENDLYCAAVFFPYMMKLNSIQLPAPMP